ncbi:uncharacterized protein LOC110180606 [Drosophila serrata]|uniref:uncharacterized protein LOC110180606 n=1 Tax=Drosophila serrata TaxID=7274 RepID=UPI000A1D1B2A|nr:uncharacterized protein LOC110180606 [Drosophila serrata]
MFSLQQLAASGLGNATAANTTTSTAAGTARAIAKATTQLSSQAKFGDSDSHNSPSHADGYSHCESESDLESAHHGNHFPSAHQLARKLLEQRSQDIQRQIHTQSVSGQRAKSSQQQQQQTTTKFAMSSLAAEPLQAHKADEITASGADNAVESPGLGASCHDVASASASAGTKACFSTGLGEIIQFMELIGNLKVCET